ncbi:MULTISPECIES: hypothetical protein [Streptomyces]|uniref:hypothetical protein n=1 Tax=Streptomyces TaxID=1883 RepID=UPI000A7745BF|nr:hypothetical protein [Streptomyces sp. NRRL F-4707]
MANSTVAAIRADASDDLLRRLYQETAREVPAEQRVTCPVHLDWRDRCRHLHQAA